MRVPMSLVSILMCGCLDDSASTANFAQGGSHSMDAVSGTTSALAGSGSGVGSSDTGIGGAMAVGGGPGGGGSSSGGVSANGGGSAAGASGDTGASGVDPFGVRKLQPTKPGGREWYLPETADT